MSQHNETIAQLTGKLVFQIDASKLQAFNQMMQAASQKMAKLGAEYTKLAQQMTKPLKLKINTEDAVRAKTKLNQAMNKELKAETALQKAKRDTFQAEASQLKWTYSNKKQQANLVTALVKDQQQHAVQLAKAANAQQQANGVTKQQVASQSQLVALQTKQAKLQQTYAKTQAITQKRDANHLLTQSKSQQIQIVAQRIAQQTQHQAIQHQARMASLAAAANAKQNASNNAQTKFQWASQKHAVWQANQAARAAKAANASNGGIASMMRGGVGSIGLGIAEALGPVGMGLAAAAAAITYASNKMQERIERRQEGVVEAQTFNNKFSSISKNPIIAKEFRDSFIESQNTNGSAIDNDTASDFRVLASGMLASNKSKDEILKTWNLRQSAFAVAGTSKDDNRELNKQLNQLASDGTGTKADADIINNRMPMVLPYVVKAYMKENKIADYEKGLKAFNKDLKGGKGIKDSWYTGAFQNLVANSAGSLKTNRESVASNLQRGANQTFLQENGINSDPAMAAALNERTEANKRLTDSMLPVNQAFERMDKSLTNFDTGVINLTSRLMNFLSGKNSDGTADVNGAPRPGSVGAALGTRLNKQSEQQRLDGNVNGTFASIRRFFTGSSADDDRAAADDNRKRWGMVQANGSTNIGSLDLGMNQTSRPGFLPQIGLTPEALTQYFGNVSNWQPAAMPIQEVMSNAANNMFAPSITVEGSTLSFEFNGTPSKEDREQIMNEFKTELDKRDAKMPEIAEKAVTGMLGRARAQQAERQ
jgi:hypothetical protein